MVEISKSGSGEGLGWATGPGYSTVFAGACVKESAAHGRVIDSLRAPGFGRNKCGAQEALIAAIHRDWGEMQGNYDEFRFFTGLRPSEQIALLVDDCDVSQGKLKVSKACVMKRDKDRTKTGVRCLISLARVPATHWAQRACIARFRLPSRGALVARRGLLAERRNTVATA
jgi:hypothetical protein